MKQPVSMLVWTYFLFISLMIMLAFAGSDRVQRKQDRLKIYHFDVSPEMIIRYGAEIAHMQNSGFSLIGKPHLFRYCYFRPQDTLTYVLEIYGSKNRSSVFLLPTGIGMDKENLFLFFENNFIEEISQKIKTYALY